MSKFTTKKHFKMFLLAAVSSAAALFSFCASAAENEVKPVKYVFLFIGDGMATPQRMVTDMYLKETTGKGLCMNALTVQGYTTTYSSLAEELRVSAGDEVKLGQAIGCVGSTALVETAIGPHVHFSVTYRDEQMDPAEFLALGK